MKIAMVCEFPFLNPTKGVELRLNQVAEHLSEIGDIWPIIITRLATSETKLDQLRDRFGKVSYVVPDVEPPNSLLGKISRLFSTTQVASRGYSVSPRLACPLVADLKACDLVWFHSMKVADSLGVYRWSHGIVDLDDLHSEKYRQQANLTSNPGIKLGALWRALLWRRWERSALHRFHNVVVCSREDTLLLGGTDTCVAVPNAVELRGQRLARNPSPDRIGFIGNLDYHANRDAIRWFVRSILPTIALSRPAIRFRVVGAAPKSFQTPANPNVDMLGYLDDTESEMATWSASVAPLRIGGGTRLKILESFARRCPVISTTLGCYGLTAKDNIEIRMADNSQDFANDCLELCRSPDVGRALAEAGFVLWQTKFTHAAVRPIVHSLASSVVNGKRSLPLNRAQTPAY